MKPEGERYTVAVDFDGVLHSYTSPWIDAATIPDPPVPGAIEWLYEIREKFEIVIFTTRGKTLEGQWAVRGYLRKHLRRHLGQSLEAWEADERAEVWVDKLKVTAEKPAALVYIDDRAWRFEGRFPSAETIHRAIPWNKKPCEQCGARPALDVSEGPQLCDGCAASTEMGS